MSWDRAQLVGLGIPLRFIAKPSYSPPATNPNVVANAFTDKVDMDEINDTDDLISVGTHLTKEEADSIKTSLTSMNIDFVANGHDAASRYHSLYYEIRVQRKDFEKARTAVNSRQRKTLLESRQCPKCQSKEYRILEKKGLWQKLYYYGTTLVQCKKCRTKYPI